MRYQVITTLTPRQALGQARRLWTRQGRVADHVPEHLGLVFQGGGGHRRDRVAWRRDDVGIGDARMGLCRAAVHGAGAPALPLVAALVALPAGPGTSRPASFTVLDHS